MRPVRRSKVLVAAAAIVLAVALPDRAWAHCDTLDGPVVKDARTALERGDVVPVLKWVKLAQEAEVRTAFQKARAVRVLGPEAQNLADIYFFETVVRVHRAGEGAPYTGLKPAGSVEPVVAAADRALANDSVDELAHTISRLVAEGIRHRFNEAAQRQRHAGDGVAAGRRFVAAYVEFVHYVERLHADAAGLTTPHDEVKATATPAGHDHD